MLLDGASSSEEEDVELGTLRKGAEKGKRKQVSNITAKVKRTSNLRGSVWRKVKGHRLVAKH